MRNSILCIIVFIFILIYFYGCETDTTGWLTPAPSTEENVAVIVNAPNSYTFTLKGNDYSKVWTDSLSFDSDSLVIALTVTNYIAGSGTVTLLASDSTQIFRESLDENKNKVQLINNPGKFPGFVEIRITDFTGDLAFVVSLQKE